MSYRNQAVGGRGFTIIEVLITIFIIGTVITGLFGLFVLVLQTAHEGERRVVALALANERAEMIRNLPYASVGTQGGIPAGAILQTEQVTRNDAVYQVKTDIRYVDDSYDGTITSNPGDFLNIDYKQARVEVIWNGSFKVAPIVLVTYVAPAGLEGGDAGGTLDFQVLNAAGQGVSDAVVTLANTTTNPEIAITTQTDVAGRVVLPGLPPATGTYQLSASKTGFTTAQTFDASSNFTPSADYAHLSMLTGEVTAKTFVIDQVSGLTVRTQSEAGAVIGSVPYRLAGTKTWGADATGKSVYQFERQETTDVTGQNVYTGVPWDTYDFVIDGVATGYDIKETNLIVPTVINPGQSAELIAKLVPHTPYSLQVTVTSSQAVPVDNATVRVQLPSTPVIEQGTGVVGQVFFSNLPQAGTYTVTVDAPGYETSIGTIDVEGTDRYQAQLTGVE